MIWSQTGDGKFTVMPEPGNDQVTIRSLSHHGPVMVQSLSCHGFMPVQSPASWLPVTTFCTDIVQNLHTPMAKVMTQGHDLSSASV